MAAVVVLVASSAQDARAWCQALSVSPPAGVCTPRCMRPSDFPASDGVVALAWTHGCSPWTLHPDGTPDLPRETVEATIARAFATWTEIDCGGGPVGFVTPMQVAPDARCGYRDHALDGPNVNTITFAADWSGRLNSPRAFAFTHTWYNTRTGEIYGADMELNDERRTWTVCPDAGCPDDQRVDLENVLAHEVGHWLGFGHSAESEDSTMSGCSDAGEVLKRDLTDDDRAGLCELYAAGLDSTCDVPTEAPSTCSFLGRACDPARAAATCNSGYCVDLGAGPECTVPCGDDPAQCPDGFACVEAPGGGQLCAQQGCGCRAVGGRGPRGLAWLGLLGLLAALRRRAQTTSL